MPLDPRRNGYVTASQAHRVMAGFELEIAGAGMEQPAFDGASYIESIVRKTGKAPLVGAVKSMGLSVSGADIKAVYSYVKATTPVFSDGMESVAREIAMAGFIQERDDRYKSLDMERGNVQEGQAITELSKKTGVVFDNAEQSQVFMIDGDLGVTPDGIEYHDFDVVSCAEVKNPVDTTHMRYLTELSNQDDLLRIAPIYYWQAQCGLTVTGAKTYHWMSFHNGFVPQAQCVYVPVVPADDHIKLLRTRSARVIARSVIIATDLRHRYFGD